MPLNKDQIKAANLISDASEDNFKDASYDLTVSNIIDMNGNEHKFYKIPPQGMVYAVFKEKISLGKELIGFAHVKTSLTQRGIMATNIGIIDPGYVGYISTLLINFGSSSESIIIGDPYLRLTFDKIDAIHTYQENNKVLKSLDHAAYINQRKKDTDNLAEKFLNLNSVKEDVFKKVVKALIGLSIIFSAASFAVGMYFQNKTSSDKNMEKLYNSNEDLMNEFKIENIKFKKEIKEEIDSLKLSKKKQK